MPGLANSRYTNDEMMTTLTGENDFLRSRELASLVDKFLAENGELGLEKIDGEDSEYSRIQEAITSLPFLASRKLIVFKNPSSSKDFLENYEKLLARLPETSNLVLVETKMDKRTSLYKWLKKASDFKEFNQLDASKLASWIVNETKTSGGEISASDARYLVERAGEDQQKLASELAKLLAYGPKINRDSVDKLVAATPASKIFDLLDAAFSGDKNRAIRIYREQRQLGEEPQKIIGLLAWQLHLLALVKAAKNKSPSMIASEAKISPYSLNNASRLARNISLADVKKYVADLLALDLQLKSTSLDANEALETYLLGLG